MATRAAESKQSNTKQISNKQSKPVTKQQPVDVSHVSRKEKSDVDDFDYDSIIQKADSTDNPDGYKYQVAVQMAGNKAGPDIDDADMRDLVDSEFAKLNPTATGAQMRGEDNVGAQIVGGLNEAKDNISEMIGSGIDGLWDGIVGGGAGIIGSAVGAFTGDENTGNDWNNFVSGLIGDEENAVFDTRALGDIATGIGIAAIPGIGVPLSAGIALLDNADNIREAIEGRDSITREKLDTDEQATKLGSAALDTFLAAAPGIGKLKNATALRDIDDILANSDDLAKGISEASTLRKSLSPSNMASIARDSAKTMPSRTAERFGNIGNAFKNGSGVRGRIGDTFRAARTPTDQYRQQLSNMMAIGDARKTGDLANDISNIMKKADDNAGVLKNGARAFKDAIIPSGPGEIAGNIIGTGAAGFGGLAANGLLNYAAETNQNPYEAMSTYGSELKASDPNALISYAIPIGMNAIMGANRLPGRSGKYNRYMNPSLRYAQLNAGGEKGSRIGQANMNDISSADTLADWIDSFNGNDDSEEE